MSALSWGYYVVGVSVLLGIGALLLEGTLRAAGRGGRWAWLVCLAASLALPLVALLTPEAAPLPSPSAAAVVLQAPVLVLAPLVATVGEAGPDLGVLVWWGWGAASAVLLGLMLLSHLALLREAAAWRATRLGDAEVWLSARRGPAVVGIRRPRIVLPEWALGLGAGDRWLMVLHEQEHVRARDPGLLLLALLVCALVPWNPVAWWALRRLRGAIELDCDARVLQRAGDPAGYGRLLVEVGRRRSEGYLFAAAFAEPRVLLERRVRALLQWPRGRRPLAASVLGGAALLCFGFAYAAPSPLARAEPAPPAAAPSLEQSVLAVQDTLPQLRNGEEVRRLMQTELPPALRELRQAGNVLLAVHVSEAGLVSDARISEGSGNAQLDSAALRIARRMEFVPARSGGRPVAMWSETLLVFGSAFQGGSILSGARITRAPLPPAAPRPGAAIADAPGFTPMTKRPELTNAAEVQRLLVAEYPPELRAAGIGGKPTVWHYIDENGRVAKVLISATSGHAELDSAAVRVARSMMFTPAENRGERVAVWVEIPIVFSAGGAPRAAPAMTGDTSRSRAPVFTPMTVKQDTTALRAPTFTPMTVRPALINSIEVMRLLQSEYPPQLRTQGVGGKTSVWFFIDEQGKVLRTQVSATSGHPELDAAALRVASGMQFSPAYNRDQRVPVWVEIPIVFTARSAEQQQQGARAVSVEQRPLANPEEVRAALTRSYPPLLRDAGIGGQALIWVYAEADGTPTRTQLATPSGYQALDEAALKLVGVMRFAPAEGAGWIEVPVVFSVK